VEVFKNMLDNGYFHKQYQEHLEKLKIDALENYIAYYNKTYRVLKDNKPKYLSVLLNNEDQTSEDEEIRNLGNDNNIIEEADNSASSGYTTLYSEEVKEEAQILDEREANSSENDRVEHESVDGYDDILNNERFKNSKINKNQLTIKPRTKEEVQEYQQQEKERYKYPHLPWEYKNPDDSSSIVAPVLKKIYTQATSSKPREHLLLKSDRPSYVTILSLGRDAAARLPDGIGTRADICDLLKDSQYVNERLSDQQINNIVSGALDRLHYEKDPCVKYDLQKKLWIYLHKNRTLDYLPWNEHLKKDKEGSELELKEDNDAESSI
jgi:hypothetical protein